MNCQQCNGKDFKTATEVGDAGDIERTVCANDACMFIMKEVLLVERGDGTKQRRPRAVKVEDQPDSYQSKGLVVDDLPSVEQMTRMAIESREETVNKRAREIAKIILEECAGNSLKGEHTHLIEEENSPPGEVIKQAVKELTDRGYKVKKVPVPGEGIEVHVKWPTKKSSRKTKRDAQAAPQVEVVATKAELTPKQKKQADERAKRKAALRARSGSQK